MYLELLFTFISQIWSWQVEHLWKWSLKLFIISITQLVDLKGHGSIVKYTAAQQSQFFFVIKHLYNAGSFTTFIRHIYFLEVWTTSGGQN